MKKIWTTILENIIIFGGIWAFLYFLAEEQQKTWTTRSRNARKGIVSEYYEWRILIFAVTTWIILYLILDKKRYELRCKIRLRSIGILLFFAFFYTFTPDFYTRFNFITEKNGLSFLAVVIPFFVSARMLIITEIKGSTQDREKNSSKEIAQLPRRGKGAAYAVDILLILIFFYFFTLAFRSISNSYLWHLVVNTFFAILICTGFKNLAKFLTLKPLKRESKKDISQPQNTKIPIIDFSKNSL